ncbi:MAG: amidase [Woeseiaceae bacterium]|nr:amidase [Woeseiaceae bacterium]
MDRREFLAGTGGVATLAAVAPKSIEASELPADITDMSASTLSAAIREGHVSCVEVMQAYLARIDRYNPVYNAIVSRVDDDELIRQAELADAALASDEYWGWMHGMPHAIKDGTDVEGMPTSRGSPIFAGTIATQDDPTVARIRAQGAIFIGKTNLPEFGMGSQTYNPVFGATGSAYDPELTAGGSTGGGACGLGTRMLPVADGGDMMGSLRNPGAFNNVIGLRPTFGRVVDGRGGSLFYQQLGTSGPMGRNSEDTYRLLHTMAGTATNLPLALRDRIPPPQAFRPLATQGIRIGWLGDYDGYLETERGILEMCETNLKMLGDHGVIVEPGQPDFDMDRLWQTWLTLRHWTRHALRPLYDDKETRKLLKPEAIWEIEGSFDASAADIYHAGNARGEWFHALRRLFEDYDFLALPTAQVFPFPKDIHWPKRINRKRMDTYHRWMEVVIGGTLASLPVANVPVGFDDDGRPMGMQILGPFGDDRKVLEFAAAYEQITGHLDVRPELVEPA